MQILIVFLNYFAILLNIGLVLRALPWFLGQGLAGPRIDRRCILPRIPKAVIIILLLPKNVLLLLQNPIIPTFLTHIYLSQPANIRSLHLLPLIHPSSIGGPGRIARDILQFFGGWMGKEAHLLIEE